MTVLGTAPYMLLLLFGYLVAPTALVWGWVRWMKQQPRLWTISSTLSFVGFLLASASALFALGMIHYALAGWFEHTSNTPNFALLPMDATRRGAFACGICLCSWGRLSAKLDSVASSCECDRNPRVLADRNNLAMITSPLSEQRSDRCATDKTPSVCGLRQCAS